MRLVWALLLLLVLVGVTAAIARVVFVEDLASRGEPFRTATLDAAGIRDPHAAARPAEARRFDGRFASHPLLTSTHVGLGALFLLLAPLQFSARFRARHLRLHRWSGRVLLATALIGTTASLYFGLFVPFAGWRESVAIVVFAALFLFSLARAFVAIRRRQVALHREWMIRAFAVAIGISTVRLVMIVIDAPLTLAGFDAVGVFLVAIWTGWLVTVGAAEVWIRRTREPAGAIAAARAA